MEAFAEKHGFSLEEASERSVPLNEYEIHVDEVLMGDLAERTIILRRYEGPGAARTYADPEMEWLFFLVINPDGRTYALQTQAGLYADINGHYYNPAYPDTLGQGKGPLVWDSPDFMPTEVRSVEDLVMAEIQRQTRSADNR